MSSHHSKSKLRELEKPPHLFLNIDAVDCTSTEKCPRQCYETRARPTSSPQSSEVSPCRAYLHRPLWSIRSNPTRSNSRPTASRQFARRALQQLRPALDHTPFFPILNVHSRTTSIGAVCLDRTSIHRDLRTLRGLPWLTTRK